MHDQRFWQNYINENSESIKIIIDRLYKKLSQTYQRCIQELSLNMNAVDAHRFVRDRLMTRLLNADELYQQTDEKEVPSDDKAYFKRQAAIVVHSYFWSTLVTQYYEQIQSIIRRKCFSDERKDVLSYINEQLVHNDFRILRRYNVKEKTKEEKKTISPENYLVYIVHMRINAFFDEGCNIPAWIKKLKDKLLKKIFQYLCCRKKNEDEFIPKLIGHKYSIIKKNIHCIQQKHPDCGYRYTEVCLEDTYFGHTPDEMDIEAITLKRLLNVVIFETYDDHPEDTLLIESLKKDLNNITIRDDQRLMLQLFFFEGYTYKEIGEKMGMRTDQISGQIRPIRENIKSILSKYLK
jgi:RNA polymerase sigma factor (sigma-70 family)